MAFITEVFMHVTIGVSYYDLNSLLHLLWFTPWLDIVECKVRTCSSNSFTLTERQSLNSKVKKVSGYETQQKTANRASKESL